MNHRTVPQALLRHIAAGAGLWAALTLSAAADDAHADHADHSAHAAHAAAAADAAADAPVVAPASLPGNSVYQLPARLTNQEGQGFALADRRGHPMLIGMFYTSCEFVCPMLVEALRNTEAQLSEAERSQLSVLLITIDPARDSVAVLKRTARERDLAPPHWTLARSDAASTRKIAAVLGLQYRALPNGDFNHSTDLILLDAQGRVAARTAQLSRVDPAFLNSVKLATQTLSH